MLADAVKRGVYTESQRIERMAVTVLYTFVDLLKTYSADAAYGIGEVFVYNLFFNADGLEYLRRLILLYG